MTELATDSGARPLVRAPAIGVVGITKRFPGVDALRDVTFDVQYGEIHALVGENGAGKSTLISCLVGLLQPDLGDILFDGDPVALRNPRDARARGISAIPQEPLAVPGLTAGRNVLLGRERFLVHRDVLGAEESEIVQRALERSGAGFSPGRRASELSVAEVRLIQIARTLVAPGDVIVLDEPTAVLSEADADALLQRLLAFKAAGKAIVYVSHRLNEVLRIADRITVLRDGTHVGTFERGAVDRRTLIAAMAKRATSSAEIEVREDGRHEAGPLVLEVDSLVLDEAVPPVAFSARAGEVVGIAGVQGSGHGALLRAIAGLVPRIAGEVRVGGRRIPDGSTRAAYRAGIVLVPADRRRAGVVGSLSVRDNLVLPAKTQTSRRGVRLPRLETRASRHYLRLFDVRAPGLGAYARTLSGGNQQKLALARAVESDPRVLLLEEPTQGIDVGAKREVRRLIREMASKRDRAIVVASSEFEDLLELADVIHVMSQGQITATLPAHEATYETLLHHALP